MFSTKKYALHGDARILFSLVLLLVAIIYLRDIVSSGDAGTPVLIEIGGSIIRAEVADTTEKRVRGLSGRSGISADAGMLFVFSTSGRPAFWMKDMNFPIDIIWIRADRTIASVTPDVFPSTYPGEFVPDEPVKYVLEVRGGFARSHGITAGERAIFHAADGRLEIGAY